MGFKSGLKAGQSFSSLIFFSLINCCFASLICAGTLSLTKMNFIVQFFSFQGAFLLRYWCKAHYSYFSIKKKRLIFPFIQILLHLLTLHFDLIADITYFSFSGIYLLLIFPPLKTNSSVNIYLNQSSSKYFSQNNFHCFHLIRC